MGAFSVIRNRRESLGRRVVSGAVASTLLIALCAPMMFAARAAEVSTRVASSQAAHAFSHAHARGTLIVGVPFLTPEPAAGAKIRTPERLDGVMAARLGKALGLPVRLVQMDQGRAAAALEKREIDVLIVDRIAGAEQSPIANAVMISTGYAARPKAIIRSDTALREWKDIKGLTVCMSTAAFQAQRLATQWGATVRPYRVPSDALVAVREGNCDIGLVDDVAWTPLMKFPEWKKFSSTLGEEGPRNERVWVVQDDPVTQAWMSATMAEWRRDGVIQSMIDKWARDVAFDVYLDQEVPDCHG